MRVRTLSGLVISILLVSLVGCVIGSEEGFLGRPPDIINDQLRGTPSDFSFETVLAVDLALDVNLYETSDRAFAPEVNGNWPIYLSMEDENGNPIYGGVVWSDSQLEGTIWLPADTEEVQLSLGAVGYEDRTVTIEKPTQYETIDRVMGMAVVSGDLSPDTDADGVPDPYDNFPNDPQYWFSMTLPNGSELLTVAFEDNYPTIGDGDYNDFVGQYTITEFFGSRPLAPADSPPILKTILVEAYAVGHMAGYDHSFGMAIGIPGRTANASVWYYDENDVLLNSESQPASEWANVVLFESTAAATTPNEASTTEYKGYRTLFELKFTDLLNVPDDSDVRHGVENPPFDPYIVVDPTGEDIHLMGKPALADRPDGTPSDDFLDDNNFPWVLTVPTNWACPADTNPIQTVYDYFDEWRLSNGAEHTDWYSDTYDVNRAEEMAFPF